MTVDRATSADTATKRMEAARRNRERLIFERNVLVAILTRLWPSHRVVHAYKQTAPWRDFVCIHSPAGQLVWHITDDEAATVFAHLKVEPNDWDGHTHNEKILRLCNLAQMEFK